MKNETSDLRKIYSPLFEPGLLKEIKEKSNTFTAATGQGLIKMGQAIQVVPLPRCFVPFGGCIGSSISPKALIR